MGVHKTDGGRGLLCGRGAVVSFFRSRLVQLISDRHCPRRPAAAAAPPADPPQLLHHYSPARRPPPAPPPDACPASASSIDTPRSRLAAVLCGARYPFAVQLPCQQQRKQSLSRTLTTLAHGIRSSAPPCLSRKHPPSPNRPRATPPSRPRVIRPKCTSLP
jgi:hypothetical protein